MSAVHRANKIRLVRAQLVHASSVARHRDLTDRNSSIAEQNAILATALEKAERTVQMLVRAIAASDGIGMGMEIGEE